MKRLSTLILFLFFTATAVKGQSVASVQRQIARLEAQGHIVEAAQLHISMHDDGEREASIKAALALYKLGKYKESLFYFEHADSIGTLDHSDEVLGYFQALKSHQRYAEADELIATHLPKVKDPENISIHNKQERNYQKYLAYKNSRVTTMPVNTPYSEFGPSVLNGWLYFESTRIIRGNDDVHGVNNQAFYNLYAHPIGAPNAPVLQPKGSWDKRQEYIAAGSYKTLSIPAAINQDHHDAPVFVTPEGNFLFFTTNWDHDGKKAVVNPYLNLSYSASALENSQKIEVDKSHLNLYYSSNKDNVWSAPVPFPYNNDGWSNQHAFFDEKSSTLYFSSNMPGGMGAFDIWKSQLRNGQWTKPENLGPMVNTSRSEVFPVLSPEGFFLFSSNGWPGLGGMDLFMVEDPALPPLNLLAGMNTEMDDFGMNFYDKGKGFFVSNRKESIGDDDLFEFAINLADIIDYQRPSFQVVVVNAETGERIPQGVMINGQDKSGKVRSLGPDKPYVQIIDDQARFVFSTAGFDDALVTVSNDGASREVVVKLSPKVVSLPVVAQPLRVMEGGKMVEVKVNPVYFNYMKYDIRKESTLVMLKKVLSDYPQSKVLLTGHTDTRGSVQYNERLSQQRVESVRDWLISRGIADDRIQTRYLGETSPAVSCANLGEFNEADRCLTEQQHQLNRRVEVELTVIR